MALRTIDLGPVSSYAIAVEKGYTGTEAEWYELIHNVTSNAEAAASSASSAAQSAATAVQAVADVGTAKDAAIAAIQGEGNTQTAAVTAEGATQIANVQSAEESAVDAVEAQQGTSVQAVYDKGVEQIAAVGTAGTTQIGLVQAEGATQIAAVEAKGEEVIESIPEDYTALTDEVDDLKSALNYLEDGTIEPDFTWENGSWNASGKEASTTRIRPDRYILASEANRFVMSTDSGYQFALFMWNENGTYKGYYGTSWQTELDYATETGWKYAITVRKTDNSTISPTEKTNFHCTFYKTGIAQLKTASQSSAETTAKVETISEGLDGIGVYQPNATLKDKNGNDISDFLLSAIKDIYLLNAPSDNYSIGTFVRSSIDHHFQLTIWDSEYAFVCQVYIENASSYTGVQKISLTMLNSSGITGEIELDFDVITEGTSYDQLIYSRAGFSNSKVYGTLREQYLQDYTETGAGIGTHRWKGKKWYAIGDSFTAQNIYPYYLNEYCGFSSYYNAGQSGKGMSSMADKLSVEAVTNYDIITVFAGTNDYGAGTTLGTIADTSSTASFYGYARKVIEAIFAQKKTARVVFMTPTIRGAFEDQPVYPAANSAGVTLDKYADAIIEVCAEYAIPVLDLFRLSQFNTLTLTTLTQDNLHPNYDGGKLLARQIQGFIEAL